METLFVALMIFTAILMMAAAAVALYFALGDYFAMNTRRAQIRSMNEELDRGVSYERNLELTAIVNRMLAE